MSEAATRALLKTAIEGVSNIGRVYDYERWCPGYTELLDKFKTKISGSNVIRGWTITCEGWPDMEKIAHLRGVKSRTYIYKIRGYFGLNDDNATEKNAIALAETVCDTLDEDSTIHPANSGPSSNLCTLDVFEPRLFGNTLCHYIEITQRITESLKV